VINATGVFADAVRRLDEPEARSLVVPSQGAHVVLDRSFLPGDSAMMIPRTRDGRVLFAIPWHGRVIVGTTDTPVADISPDPRPLEEEIAYLLGHAGQYLAQAPGRRDVLSMFAGLRPLAGEAGAGRATAALARDHRVIVSPSGLVSVIGGKWTTYRRMGRDAVDAAARVGGLPRKPSRTEHLSIHGAGGVDDTMWSAYGADAPAARALASENPQLEQPLHPRLPYRLSQVTWAVREEMACTLEDVLARRTRALILDARASLEAAPGAAELMAKLLGRDAAWQQAQLDAYRAVAARHMVEV
jgi:glycerol-3-phosphate dehydrogenase